MTGIWASDIDSSLMLKVGLGLGVPFLISLIFWTLINSKIVHWRPFSDLSTIFSLLLSHKSSSFPGDIVSILWMIFYIIPYALPIIFGVIMFIKFSPAIFGLIFVLVIPAYIGLFALIKYYSKQGYNLGFLWKLVLCILIIAIIVTPFVYVFLYPFLSWMGCGYLFAWPPIIVFSLIVVIRRRRIKDITQVHSLEVGNFEQENSAAYNGNDRFKWYDYFIHILISLACAIVYAALFWKKDEKVASYATAIMFFGLDVLLLIVYITTHFNVLSISLAILALILKSVIVTFTVDYWFVGHGVIFFFLIIVALAKFIFDLWCFRAYDVYQIRCEQIIDNLVLMNHGQRKVDLKTVVFEGISVIVLLVAIVVDGVLTMKSDFSLVYNTISQQNLTLILEIIALCIGLAGAGFAIMFQLEGRVNIPAIILFVVASVLAIGLSAGVPCFYNTITLRATFSPIFVSLLCSIGIMIVSSFDVMLTFKSACASICDGSAFNFEISLFVFSIFWIISTPLIIILPFVIKGCEYWSLILASLLTGIVFYAYFFRVTIDSDNLTNSGFLQLACSIILFACFSVGIGAVTKWINTLITALVIGFFASALIGVAYEHSSRCLYSFTSLLYILIPSALIAIGSLIYLILAKVLIAPCIAIFITVAVFFGTLAYGVMKKEEKFNWKPLICIIVMCLLMLADIIYLGIKMDKPFLALTVICIVIFGVSFVFTLILLFQSNELTYSSLFYPVRYYSDNTLLAHPLLNLVFAIDEVLPIIWGLFTIIFSDFPQYGYIGVIVSLAFIPAINLLLMALSDDKTNFSLQYAPNNLLEDTLNVIRGIGAIDGADNNEIIVEELTDYKDFIAYKKKMISVTQAQFDQVNMYKARISSVCESEFMFVRQFLHDKYKKKIKNLGYLLEEQNWSADERRQIFEIYDAVKKQDADEQAARLYYEHLASQAALRIQNRNQLDQQNDQALQQLLGDDLLKAERELQQIKENIRQKEAEAYKRRKEMEIRRQQMIQQRIEEDRRRKQEEEELKKIKDAEDRERRRQQALERKRKEEERRRREDEEERRKQEEEERKRREEEEALKKLKAEQDRIKREEEERLRRNLGNTPLSNIANMQQSQYTRLLVSLMQRKQKFSDPTWYPQQPKAETPEVAKKLNESVFDRLENQFPEIMDQISQTNFQQGRLGDCYLVAAMSALAEDPKLVQQIFEQPIKNNAYISCVSFHRFGKVDKVTVDTFVPFYQNRPDRCAFTSPDSKTASYWPAIVEKAYAKYFGSYSAINGGCSHVALYHLTGFFPYQIEIDLPETRKMFQDGSLWRQIFGFRAGHNFLCAGSNGGSDTQKDALGIVLGHAYTILGIYEYKGTQFVKLRNTWGDTEWKGPWCDTDPRWTDQLRQRLGISNKDDGIFMMAFNDFMKHFNRIYCCLRTTGRYNYVMKTSFKAGCQYKVNKGSEFLTQWKLTMNRPTNLWILYEKTSVTGNHQIVMKKTSEKIKNLYVHEKSFHEAAFKNMEVTSWIYQVNEVDEPWFLVPYVIDCTTDVDVCIQIWSDIEIGCEEYL